MPEFEKFIEYALSLLLQYFSDRQPTRTGEIIDLLNRVLRRFHSISVILRQTGEKYRSQILRQK